MQMQTASLEGFRKLNKNIKLSRADLMCNLPKSLRDDLYTLSMSFIGLLESTVMEKFA